MSGRHLPDRVFGRSNISARSVMRMAAARPIVSAVGGAAEKSEERRGASVVVA